MGRVLIEIEVVYNFFHLKPQITKLIALLQWVLAEELSSFDETFIETGNGFDLKDGDNNSKMDKDEQAPFKIASIYLLIG